MIVDQVQVEGLRRLKVMVAEFVLGVQLQVEEVVVDVECDQAQACPVQGLSELDGRSGFPGRGGPGEDDDPSQRPPLHDHLSCRPDLLLVGPVGLFHDLAEVTSGDARIQALHRREVVID